MKIIKIILGVLFTIGLLGSISTFFKDISNGVEGAVLFGEGIAIAFFGFLVYYLFSSSSNSNSKNSEIRKND